MTHLAPRDHPGRWQIMQIEVPGVPIPKGRPRMTRSGRAYTPSKTRSYESDIRVLGRAKMAGREPYSGPLSVIVTAYLPIPESWPKWKRALVTDHGTFVAHTVKPDIDNLGKVIDGLNGVVWVDDSQISDLLIAKRYSTQPRLIVEVHHDTHGIHAKTKRRPTKTGVHAADV